MSLANVISLLGGVALFLFGMLLMGEGLKKVAGSKLELILYRLSSTPLKGLLLGTGVTAVIQSSSATSVMVVGFVNSNMMKLRQAISVVLGALVGTSVTGWVICLSSLEGAGGWVSLLSTSTITAVVAVVGIALRMFSHVQSRRHLGDILLGFSVLMYGMSAMSGAVSPLRQSESFLRLLTAFSNPFLGIIVGAVFTSILQSASAAVGILQALSMTGAITFAVAYPIILGIAIGAAVPVLMSAIGAKVAGRRTALAYLVIEILGVLLCGIAFYGLDAAFDFSALKGAVMSTVSVAAANSLFRLVTALLLLPFVDGLVKIVTALVKESSAERSLNAEFERLDERFLKHPALAIEQTRLTVNSMARVAGENISRAMDLIFAFDKEAAARIERDEELVDSYEDKLGSYLMRLNRSELSREENESVSKFLHTLSDFERISDHAMNLGEAAQEISDKKIQFSAQGETELHVLCAAVKECLTLALEAFTEADMEKAYRVEPLEEHIDVLCDEIKLRHVERLQTGECHLQTGFVFNDILTNLERVADHCSNLAVAMIELGQDNYDTHDYIINLKELRSHNFDELYAGYAKKYGI